MQYRIKEVVKNGRSFYYPQWQGWFGIWRRFTYNCGEDLTVTPTVVCTEYKDALKEIEEDKEWRKLKPQPRKIIYHST